MNILLQILDEGKINDAQAAPWISPTPSSA